MELDTCYLLFQLKPHTTFPQFSYCISYQSVFDNSTYDYKKRRESYQIIKWTTFQMLFYLNSEQLILFKKQKAEHSKSAFRGLWQDIINVSLLVS